MLTRISHFPVAVEAEADYLNHSLQHLHFWAQILLAQLPGYFFLRQTLYCLTLLFHLITHEKLLFGQEQGERIARYCSEIFEGMHLILDQTL